MNITTIGDVYRITDDEGRSIEVTNPAALVEMLFDPALIPTAGGSTATMVRQLVAAKERSKMFGALKAKADGEVSNLTVPLVEHFADEGVTNMTVDGKMAYRHSQLWASMAEGAKDSLVSTLRDIGLNELTTVNHQTLSSEVRERLRNWLIETGTKEEDALDQIREGEFDWEQVIPEWGHLINVREQIGINVRSA